MSTEQILSRVYLEQWQGIRQLTCDYLDELKPSDLALKLPFPESQSLLNQFYCMVGAEESYLRELQHGEWQGFSSSIADIQAITPAIIKDHMREADKMMSDLLSTTDLTQKLSNGKPGYKVVQSIIEHEMHHHGQLINFMYCHKFPIPQSWFLKWHLTRDE